MPNVRQLRPEMGDGNGNSDDGKPELRKLAVQVAALLPNDLDDALKVLVLARRFVTEFLKP